MNTDQAPPANQISLIGEIASEAIFSHDVYGEKFYNFDLLVPRLSDATDLLPITISDRIMEGNTIPSKIDRGTDHGLNFDRNCYSFEPGQLIKLEGQIRSYNSYVESQGRSKLMLTTFVKDYEFLDEFGRQNPNDVMLDGYVCKPPVYRTTPFGREITDILLAVNRSYNKSDYIPCITWGRNARYASKLAVGENVKIWGRMQSRIYQKKLEDETIVEKTAYEVSVSRLEKNI